MTSPFRISIQRRPGRGFLQPALLVGTLGLAIAANTLLFTLVNVFVLKPLPIEHSDRVGFLLGTDTTQGTDRARTSMDDWLDLSEGTRSFQELAAFRRTAVTLTGAGEPARIIAEEASANLFPAWGLRVARGRPFLATDDTPGATPVALLSDRSWRERFRESESTLGEILVLDGVAHTVIGVMPPELELGNLALVEVWTPLGAARGLEPREQRDLYVSGRLREGISHEAASAEIQALSGQLRRDHPGTNGSWTARVGTTRQGLVGDGIWVVLGFLGLVVTGVLIVACANVANVLFARIAGRRVEFATRAALGASSGRIVRSLLAELLGVAALACLAGVGLAALGLRVLRAVSFEPIWSQLVIDQRVLLFAATLATLALVFAGLLPARNAARSDLRSLIDGEGGRGATSRRLGRMRRILAAAQLGAALVVVVPASLVGRSIAAEFRADWGFSGRDLVTAQITLPARRYGDALARQQFTRRLLTELAPSGAGAALVAPLPVFGGERMAGLELPGVAAERPEDRPRAVLVGASPDLFSTLGVATIAGEGLPRELELVAGAPIRALVNRAFVSRWMPGGDAVGRRVALADPVAAGAALEIVGVVEDVKSPNVTLPPSPTLYVPLAAMAPETFSVVVRATETETGAAAIRRAVAALDPELAVERPASYIQLHREEMSSNRTVAGLFASFAAIAVLLSLVGLYAVATYAVANRSREFGVRIALGADRQRIVRQVLFDGAKIAAWGGGCGLVIGAGIAQLLRARLFGVSPLDPWTFGGAAVGLALFTLTVLAIPARRAAAVEPANLLRSS